MIDPMGENFYDFSSYNYGLNNPISNVDLDGMVAEDGRSALANDYNFGPDGKLNFVVIKPGADHFYQTDRGGNTTELNVNQLTPGMISQYLVSSSSLDQEGTTLEEVIIKGKKKSANSFVFAPAVKWTPSMGEAGIEMSFPIEGLFPAFKALAPVTSILNIINSHAVMSKGGKRKIWPDEYGYPPNVKDVNWKKSDSDLANEKSNSVDDKRRGQGTPNNMARKWFRDKRPKN